MVRALLACVALMIRLFLANHWAKRTGRTYVVMKFCMCPSTPYWPVSTHVAHLAHLDQSGVSTHIAHLAHLGHSAASMPRSVGVDNNMLWDAVYGAFIDMGSGAYRNGGGACMNGWRRFWSWAGALIEMSGALV